jgi:hypothetical protein
VSDALPSNDPGTQKRRSTRIVQAVPISVTGVDALGQPFKERTTTVMVNCHGCKYQSKHYVPKNSTVTLDIPRPETSLPPRRVQGRVVWVQRPRTVRELFQIGLEFEIAGNVWGIAFPPEDWAPAPDDEAPVMTADEAASITPPANSPYAPDPSLVEAAIPEFSISQEAKAEPQAVAPKAPAQAAPPSAPKVPAQAATPGVPPAAPKVPAQAATPAAPSAPPARPAAPAAPPAQPTARAPQATPPAGAQPTAADGKIHVMPSPAAGQDSQTLVARQLAKMVADAKESLDKNLRKGAQSAITEEMTIVRQQLDAQLHTAVEHAIKASMERVTESAANRVVQKAADRTAAIVEEARKTNLSNAAELDAKVRKAVEDAVSGAAKDAAQQAAQQTAAQNLKSAVEQAVDKALSEREAATPSLQILSSPEAAQKHLDQWKKDLEETAQGVRSKTVEQSQNDIADASRRWQEQFEASLSQASERVSEKLSQASLAALTQAEQDAAARSSRLRSSVDEVVAGAQSTVEALRQDLETERRRSEELRAQLQEAARVALEQSRQKLDEMVSSQQEEIARKADQVINERAQQIQPLIENSAQKVLDHFSSEIDQRLAPKLDEVQKAASQLANVEQQAAEMQGRIRSQVEEAARQVDQLQSSAREQVKQVSDQAVQESLERLRAETAKLPTEFQDNARAMLKKLEEELQQKTTEAQHETYESLLKASEWYQKKAQTTMQTTLERAVEQSTSTLRDRAAEVSSLVASELDHYRRTYVEHSQAEIEDVAKELVDREKSKLTETAEIATAGFTDRVLQVTDESMRRFESASRDALEKARSDMEFNREGSLAEFQKKLDEHMVKGVEQARVYLQSQLLPMMEEWAAQRETQQREWATKMAKGSDDSVEQFKTRLENASNSWLLASATTLGQHSQAVLDTLAKSAEKRIRETCSDVLAGMGDTIKQRLMGISTAFDVEETGDDVQVEGEDPKPAAPPAARPHDAQHREPPKPKK